MRQLVALKLSVPGLRYDLQVSLLLLLQELMTRHKTLVAAFTYERYNMVGTFGGAGLCSSASAYGQMPA